MGLDKANIFKLNDNELTKYQKDPFLDCFESTKVFAKALKNDITTKETPHSLLLSADYGMGKTFFEIEGLFVISPTNKKAFNKKLLSKQKEQYNSYKNLSMQKLSLFSTLLKQINRYWKLNIPNILQ